MNSATTPLGREVDHLSIAVRAYAEPPVTKPRARSRPPRPSGWTVIFDTETTVDAGQALRFGSYQVRKGAELQEAGLFYRPEVLSAGEVSTLMAYASRHGLKAITQAEFVGQVFFGIGYDLRATIVGFNLPFDISRLAVAFGSARGNMRGGFTFTISADKRRSHVQVKHLSRRASFIRFAAPFMQRTGRSDRKRGIRQNVHRGYFLDVNTLAHAMLARPFKLASLADHLETATRKTEVEEHGGTLTDTYLHYACQDVQVTWECYSKLTEQYATLKLEAPAHEIYSEASLGKAYLDAMGVKPWRDTQRAVPPDLIGIVMSSYYGGRSEVRIRRERRQVMLCDFLSMYPTVCTLMALWRFVVAQHTAWEDDTENVRAFLADVTLSDLRQRETWRKMIALVKVEAHDDIFPVRAAYDGSEATTIGLNHLTSDKPLWFTLADCVASKLLTGRAPKVLRAILFRPGPQQATLRSVPISGNPAYSVNPREDDFYKRMIELRQTVKGRRDGAPTKQRDRLDAEQNAIKIAANATSYGVFVEVNVSNGDRQSVHVYAGGDEPLMTSTAKIESPGRFFHPLLATLITGAARLMLAITERLVVDRGLSWAFCDTDSMAIAKPGGVDQSDFHDHVHAVVSWFANLNPYDFEASILKVEDVNFAPNQSAKHKSLYCYAVSSKRYVLFNLDVEGRPVLRKASAHGLGHLRPPYRKRGKRSWIPEPEIPFSKLGVGLWQHDLWWLIADASRHGPVVQLPLDHHPVMMTPAVSRYAATTPIIQRWFKHYNASRPYDEQVKPFGFLLAFTAGHGHAGQPVAAFDGDDVRATLAAFDRATGFPVAVTSLKPYAAALAQYHLSPEAKFRNGRPFDHGMTIRRSVHVTDARYIGKEADRWEEQFFLGADPDASIEYDTGSSCSPALRAELVRAVVKYGQRHLADRLGIARGTLVRLLRDDVGRQSKIISVRVEKELTSLRQQ